MAFKFLKNYLSYRFSTVLGGRKNYLKEKEQYFSLQGAEIKNKKLAHLLENAAKKDGFLSYSEFLDVDQFSQYGYHGTHARYGETSTHALWPKALVNLCISNDIDTILEIGPGEGRLGVNALKEAQKQHKKLYWQGVEVSKVLQQKAKKRFAKAGLSERIVGLSDAAAALHFPKKTLAVFSYSLDSIPPDMFANTRSLTTFPNMMLGIKVRTGMLNEFYTSDKQARKKGFRIKEGKITHGTFVFNFSRWFLSPLQRAFLPLRAFTLFIQVIEKLPENSIILIIDEFRRPIRMRLGHVLPPRDLGLYDRDLRDIKKSYETAGENLWYYPCFLDSYISLLQNTGLKDISYAEEHFASNYLQKHISLPTSMSHLSYCYAILGKVNKKGERKEFFIDFPKV